MPSALICPGQLDAELGGRSSGGTPLERFLEARLEEARVMALAARPALALVDRDMPRSARPVARLRADHATHGLIAVLARGDVEPAELELLEAPSRRSKATAGRARRPSARP